MYQPMKTFCLLVVVKDMLNGLESLVIHILRAAHYGNTVQAVCKAVALHQGSLLYSERFRELIYWLSASSVDQSFYFVD